jgi:hypothetical protein
MNVLADLGIPRGIDLNGGLFRLKFADLINRRVRPNVRFTLNGGPPFTLQMNGYLFDLTGWIEEICKSTDWNPVQATNGIIRYELQRNGRPDLIEDFEMM